MSNDGEDERMNPYRWECTIHGSGYGPIDECRTMAELDLLIYQKVEE